MEFFRQSVANWWVVGTWAVLAAISVGVVVNDLSRRNAHIMPLMKTVWIIATAYSGPLGLAIYWFSGRKEISRDTLWRRGFRSTAHCYSGCGLGEIIGVSITVGLLGLGNWPTALVTFCLAYLFGFGLTVGPLVQDGESVRSAMKDAVLSESPSIAVMEIVAIGVDLLLAGNAGMSDPKFWASLVLSLMAGFLAAYPVNVALVHWGVKEGMMDPRNTGHSDEGDRETRSTQRVANAAPQPG